MFKVLFVVFIAVPIVELYVLIEVGSHIGAVLTILLTILTALVGGLLMKYQGLQVLKDAQATMSQGLPPQQQAIEGVLIFIGGAMLLLPGLITDFLGLLLLVSPLRALIAKRWLARRITRPGYGYVHTEWAVKDPQTGKISHHSASRSYGGDDNVIEGEVIDSPKKH